jgi:DNA-binding NtrC family response regulator
MCSAVRLPGNFSTGDEELRADLVDPGRFGRMLGVSPAMRRLYPHFERLASSSEPLVIEGEAGTGKELLARALYDMGPRAMGPFVVYDCARGAVDPASSPPEGRGAFEELLQQAAGGTLLLDELGKLHSSLQDALARALAGARPDVRIVVTTRTDLGALVRKGRLHERLQALVSVARIELPPLRARNGDIVYLARHFWLEGGGDGNAFPAAEVAHAEPHSWPGNVRELRDFVRELLGHDPDEIEGVVREALEAEVPYAEARRRLLVEFEQRYVERMLAVHHGNVTRAATASGLARRNFQLIRARRRAES